MNKATALLNELMAYYKVGTLQDLAEKLGVARNTISGWKSRDAIIAIIKKIYELDLPIDTLQYVNEVSGGIGNVGVNITGNSKSRIEENQFQETFEMLVMLGKSTGNLEMVEECLVECKKKIIAKSFEENA
jgi:hypothetical protein